MFKFFRQYWPYFGVRNQRLFFLLLLMSVAVSFAELLGLGMVLPFIAVLTSPDSLMQLEQLQPFLGALDITTKDQLLKWVSSGFIGAMLISGAVRISHLWLKNYFGAQVAAEVASKSFQALLNMNYAAHVSSNTSRAVAVIANKTNKVSNLAQSIVTVFTTCVLSISIVTALLFVDPAAALVSGGVLAMGYLATRKLVAARLNRNARQVSRLITKSIQSTQEAFGGVRDIILDNSHRYHEERFAALDRPQKELSAQNAFLAGVPRYIVETLAVIVVAALAYYLQSKQGESAFLMPKLGALALGAQRMLPSMQQTYSAWAGVRSASTQLREVLSILQAAGPKEAPLSSSDAELAFERAIAFKNVSFAYSQGGSQALREVSFVINKGDRIGLQGTTGSGKSTCVDLLMGLLDPTAGKVTVDDRALVADNVKSWYSNIAHVPQTIFLADATIAENIALGMAADRIDMARVKLVAGQAQLGEYIASLADGYLTRVGESGSWLSGGQRQRLGLARALYKKATVLVLDEATSALDAATEKAVMETVEGLDKGLTIITIAHRTSTLRFCDRVFTLEGGRIASVKTPLELGLQG